MKIHDRPWPCVVLRSRRGAKLLVSALENSCHHRLDHLTPETLRMVSSPLHYYESDYVGFRVPAGLQLADIEFKDRIPPICRELNGEALISYPVYHQETRIAGQACLAIMAPYVRILSQIVRALNYKTTFDFVTLEGSDFARFLETTFGSLASSSGKISQGDFKDVTIRVKSAVLPLLTSDVNNQESELRRVVLKGENIFRTKLYQRLRSGKADGNEYRLSGAKVTLLYSDDIGKGVATSISQYGAFAFRPGFGGENLHEFRRLMEFFALHEVLKFKKVDPLDIQTEDDQI